MYRFILLCLLLSACAPTKSEPDAMCAFSTTANYTLTVTNAVSAQDGTAAASAPAASHPATLACLAAASDCAHAVTTCDGETLSVRILAASYADGNQAASQSSDRSYTYTVLSSDATGISARYQDPSGTSVDVRLVEQGQ